MAKKLDFDNLPPHIEAESIIAQMDIEEVTGALNEGRQRQLGGIEPSDNEVRIGILLVRRMRMMRENRGGGRKKASAEPAKALSLGDFGI